MASCQLISHSTSNQPPSTDEVYTIKGIKPRSFASTRSFTPTRSFHANTFLWHRHDPFFHSFHTFPFIKPPFHPNHPNHPHLAQTTRILDLAMVQTSILEPCIEHSQHDTAHQTDVPPTAGAGASRTNPYAINPTSNLWAYSYGARLPELPDNMAQLSIPRKNGQTYGHWMQFRRPALVMIQVQLLCPDRLDICIRKCMCFLYFRSLICTPRLYVSLSCAQVYSSIPSRRKRHRARLTLLPSSTIYPPQYNIRIWGAFVHPFRRCKRSQHTIFYVTRGGGDTLATYSGIDDEGYRSNFNFWTWVEYPCTCALLERTKIWLSSLCVGRQGLPWGRLSVGDDSTVVRDPSFCMLIPWWRLKTFLGKWKARAWKTSPTLNKYAWYLQ